MSKGNYYKYTHELINKDGEQQKGKAYCVFDSAVSRTIMLKMFKSLRSFKSSLYPDLHEVSRYEQGGIYKEPKFSRNLQRAYFELIDYNSKSISASNIDFRLIGRESTLIELKDKRNILDNAFLTFNEALFILLGFYCILAPKYQIIDSDHPIDIAMLNTKQAQALIGEFGSAQKIPTKDFLAFAVKERLMKKKITHQKEITKNKNIKKVEKALLSYLLPLKEITNKNALVSHRDHDSFSNEFDFPRSTLLKHLTEIITLEWWIKQEKDIQDNIKKPKS